MLCDAMLLCYNWPQGMAANIEPKVVLGFSSTHTYTRHIQESPVQMSPQSFNPSLHCNLSNPHVRNPHSVSWFRV